MSETLEIFNDDHSKALDHLDRLSDALDAINDGAKADQVMDGLTRFNNFLEHALKVHFRQEEEALFPVLGRVIGTEGGPIAVMLEEHDEIEAAHAVMTEELRKENPELNKVADAGRTIIAILEPHIHKEDRVLFPMAMHHLSKEQLAEVDRLAKQIH